MSAPACEAIGLSVAYDSAPVLRNADVTVPAGSVWVMGDNRFASADSAYHDSRGEEAFVPESDITGKAFVVMWPVSHWNVLDEGEVPHGGLALQIGFGAGLVYAAQVVVMP